MIFKYYPNFFSAFSVFAKKSTFELTQRLGVSYVAHTSFDSSILNVADVQKYLKYIQADESYIKKKIGSQKNFTQVMELLEKKKEVEIKIESLINMHSKDDKELNQLIEEEKSDYLKEIENINIDILKNILVVDDESDNHNLEIQLIPGIGGEEARLFSEDLYNMYLKFIEYKNWVCKGSQVSGEKSDTRNSYILVCGNYAYDYLKNEAGVHRVQRVPETERMGRTHTSTCSIVILPRPKPNKIDIKTTDLIVERMRSSGPGGQNVNKRESCIRLKHIPTGIVVENQTSRFQNENHKLALERLSGILYNMDRQKFLLKNRNLKKEQAGSNDYADKIRTYHFTKNRITDHRINHTIHNVKGFMSGGKELDETIHRVYEANKKNSLLEQISEAFQSIEYKDYEKRSTSNI